jgi:hypothetical protein
MMQKIVIILFCVSALFGAFESREVEVPRTAYKTDHFKYYITETAKKSNTYIVSIKRVSSSAITFFKAQINCSSKVFKSLGSSSKSASAINPNYSSPWFKPVLGSIEKDIMTQVCK